MNEPVRILQWGMGPNLGGVDCLMMDIYRHIDRSKVQFDFLCDHDADKLAFEDEILEMCIRDSCYATFIGKIVPWSLETACTGFGFFVLGYLAKSPGKTWFASITRPAWLPLWLVVTAAGTWLNVTIAHQRLDVYMNEYGWYPFTMMGALGGIALVLGLLQLLEYHERTAAAKPVSSLLRYIGKNSFIFYSLNQVGLLIGEEILGACGIPLNNITWPWQLLWGGACIVIAVLLCVPMVEFTNRCFPQILGKPRRISAAS